MRYYFYYAGDIDFASQVEEAIKNKDFDTFMNLYKEERRTGSNRLLNEAIDDNGKRVSILERENFEKITEYEYEWG